MVSRKAQLTGYWDIMFSDVSKVNIGLNSLHLEKRWWEWLPAYTAPPPRKQISVIQGCVTFNTIGNLALVDANINADKHIEIPEDNLWPVVAHHFPKNDYIYQDDSVPVHRARSVVKYQPENKKLRLWPGQNNLCLLQTEKWVAAWCRKYPHCWRLAISNLMHLGKPAC